MKFNIYKASDSDEEFTEEVELNTLEELVALVKKFQETNKGPDGFFPATTSIVVGQDGVGLTIMDDYVE